MISISEIHPSLNFETIRCELRRYCREVETEIKTRGEALRESVSGPEQQLLEEDVHELLVTVRWLRQRVHSFYSAGVATVLINATAREEWKQFAQEAVTELRRIEARFQRLEADVGRSASSSVDDSAPDTPCDTAIGSGPAVNADHNAVHDEAEEASVDCSDQLCCC
ncbi:hypothetical protein GC176_13505 [bacterium]|nr:hypothetical protein [bacterium]